MRKIDCHVHTCISPDGFYSPEIVICAAIERGIEHICITDHMDIFYYKPEAAGVSDLVAYKNTLLPLKEKYKKQIYISIGIECGWTAQNELKNKELLSGAGLEYVINSIHSVNNSDCYFAKHFQNRTRGETYTEYFDAVLKSLDAPYEYHALGHLGYVTRNAPYENKKLSYSDFKEPLDAILKKLIDKNIILELNTNVCGAGSATLPDYDILARYKELGGNLITFSSDAHKPERLCDNYKKVTEKVKSLGFKYYTVIQNKELKGIKIE